MPVTEKWLRGTTLDTVLNTGSSLTNNSLALSSAYTPTDANYRFATVVFSGTWGTAPTAGTGLACWWIRNDGTTDEDGSGSVTPARPPDFVIPVRAVNSAQLVYKDVPIPPGTFKLLVKNDATGQTLNSGWTIKVLTFTPQGV